jgi:hypothetical protein
VAVWGIDEQLDAIFGYALVALPGSADDRPIGDSMETPT